MSSAYFAPIQWYQKLYRSERVYVEQHDSFIKQTYRNRCVIATANGPQTLTVPVVAVTPGRAGRDVLISDHGNWRHVHRQALISAYGESPFFEFYADDILPFFHERWERLYDFNIAITRKICELLDIQTDIRTTTDYLPPGHHVTATPQTDTIADYRDTIRPKHPLPDDDFTPQRYYQVYQHRHGFLPNLSILDLLFNMGNESLLFL